LIANSPQTVRTEPVEVLREGFDKALLSTVEGLSPNGLLSADRH
jgi:hypothetical protein